MWLTWPVRVRSSSWSDYDGDNVGRLALVVCVTSGVQIRQGPWSGGRGQARPRRFELEFVRTSVGACVIKFETRYSWDTCFRREVIPGREQMTSCGVGRTSRRSLSCAPCAGDSQRDVNVRGDVEEEMCMIKSSQQRALLRVAGHPNGSRSPTGNSLLLARHAPRSAVPQLSHAGLRRRGHGQRSRTDATEQGERYTSCCAAVI